MFKTAISQPPHEAAQYMANLGLLSDLRQSYSSCFHLPQDLDCFGGDGHSRAIAVRL